MSLRTFTRGKRYTKNLVGGFLALFLTIGTQAEWKIDLSRRVEQKRQTDVKAPETEARPQEATIFDWVASNHGGGGPTQELVILNTEQGFVPGTLRVREGGTYTIHVVNVNDKEKNVSFVMDAFSEHHATFFGKIKTFTISPKKEGIFSFVCPETSAQGRLVVHTPPGAGVRQPAAEE
ncbi:MAG: cupredoxin domain-containing protein [Bdellovibrionales bacterium]|nr:cupredoxin domain-containing protein [Bdellovibrionales bacterium]